MWLVCIVMPDVKTETLGDAAHPKMVLSGWSLPCPFDLVSITLMVWCSSSRLPGLSVVFSSFVREKVAAAFVMPFLKITSTFWFTWGRRHVSSCHIGVLAVSSTSKSAMRNADANVHRPTHSRYVEAQGEQNANLPELAP